MKDIAKLRVQLVKWSCHETVGVGTYCLSCPAVDLTATPIDVLSLPPVHNLKCCDWSKSRAKISDGSAAYYV